MFRVGIIVIAAAAVCLIFLLPAKAQQTPESAFELPVDGSVSGNMYAVTWWKISITAFGALSVSINTDRSLVVDLGLYDQNMNLVAGAELPDGTLQRAHHMFLAPDIYYIKVSPKDRSSGVYTISSQFTPASYINDNNNDFEPNDTESQAVQILSEKTYTGVLGYYKRGVIDSVDCYYVTIPVAANVFFKLVSEPTVDIDVTIEETCGCGYEDPVKVLASVGTHERYVTYTKASRIKIYRHAGGYGSYAFLLTNAINSNTPPEIFIKSLKQALVGHRYEEPVIAADVDRDDILTYTLLEGPEWLSLDKKGMLTGMPGIGDTGENIPVSLCVIDRNTLSDTLITSIDVSFEIDPPTDVQVTDVPDDQGYEVQVTWNLSTVDSYISHYNIYRSRTMWFTDPIPIDSFHTLEDLEKSEQKHTIIIGTAEAGINRFIDTYIPQNDVSYFYWVTAVGPHGESEKAAAQFSPSMTHVDSAPSLFRVYPPSPNPFNPSTTIRYEIPVECHVTLMMYDILGREVAILQNGIFSAGMHEAHWDGKDKDGKLLGSGVYLYRFTAGQNTVRGKVMFLR